MKSAILNLQGLFSMESVVFKTSRIPKQSQSLSSVQDFLNQVSHFQVFKHFKIKFIILKSSIILKLSDF